MNSPRLLSCRAPLLKIARLASAWLTFGIATCAAVGGASETGKLIATANGGRPPILWFESDPAINTGSGPQIWSATSGGQFAARGPGAWGGQNDAFGLAPDARGGAAIAGSTTQNPINPEAGTVLFFCRPGEKARPPMLLFSRADWGNPNYFSLRINQVGARQELTLAVADARSADKAVQVNLATLTPGTWHFVALSWREADGFCQFRGWAGDLLNGELTEIEHRVPSLSPAPGIFVLGGRRADTAGKYGTAPLLFAGGLFQHFAIYDRALAEDTIKSIYLAATRR